MFDYVLIALEEGARVSSSFCGRAKNRFEKQVLMGASNKTTLWKVYYYDDDAEEEELFFLKSLFPAISCNFKRIKYNITYNI